MSRATRRRHPRWPRPATVQQAGPRPRASMAWRPGSQRSVLLLLLLVPLALPGCSDVAPPQVDARALLDVLRWPVLRVNTTPSEPFELTGPILIGWSGPLFAVWAAVEPDLSRRSVIEGDMVYTNDNEGMGWTEQPVRQGIASSRLSNRLVLWDLKTLLADPAFSLQAEAAGGPEATNITAQGTVVVGGRTMAIEVTLGIVDNQVAWARQASQQARESPYTFRAVPEQFPFPIAKPPASLPASDVEDRNQRAHADHVAVIRLVQDYAFSRGGSVPDEPSESSLAVELLASGRPWPRNAFAQEPLAVGTGPGDIGWRKCSLQDATYTGLGWDGALVSQTFGRGCKA